MKYTKSTEITSHEIACEVLGKDPMASAIPRDKIKDVADAMNKVADFDPRNPKPGERLWRAYFWWDDAGGFGFSASCCGGWSSSADAGARLCESFRSKEEGIHFGKCFEALHKENWLS